MGDNASKNLNLSISMSPRMAVLLLSLAAGALAYSKVEPREVDWQLEGKVASVSENARRGKKTVE